MRICIFGAGAIGGHLAARFAKGGAEVSVIGRGTHLEAIKANGLTVHAFDGILHSRPHAATSAEELGPQDAVIVTTKAPALPSVAAGIGPLLGPDTSVAFIMNGIPWWYFDKHGGPMDGRRLPEVDPHDAIRNAIGVERAIGGVVYSACHVASPGVVISEHADIRVYLGEPDGTISARAKAIAEPMEAGGMPCPVVDDIRHRIWGKLMGNLTSGPLCLLSRKDMATTLKDPVLYAVALRLAEEGAAIAKALGHDLATPAEARIKRSAGIAHKPSILQDLELGRPMEVEALLRLPLRLGREAGVPTPTMEMLVALATQAAEAAGCYTPA
ncbi:MAG: 2-dehydropantoate 2-reductase [Rhodospirillales bacterium]|nr:2-dehydropantoate 2-reductase [Rhodospirillales bacterium]